MYGDTAFPRVFANIAPLANELPTYDFSSQDEVSYQVRYDYDLVALVPGLTFMTRYYKGENGELKGREVREWESDTNLRYVIQDGALKGVGMEYRKATYRSTYASDRDNNRLYLTYELALW